MQKYASLKDQLLLLLLSYFWLFKGHFDPHHLLYILIAVSLTFVIAYQPSKLTQGMLLVGFVLVVSYHNYFIFVLPTLLYPFFAQRRIGLNLSILTVALGFTLLATGFGLNYDVGLFGLLIVALSLRIKTLHEVELERDYFNLLDQTTEKNLLLEEQKQQLIETQNQQLILGIADERNRIARDIHDNVGHLLSSSLIQLGAIQVINRDENLNQPLNQLKETVEAGMDNIRGSVHDLYDDSLDLKASIEHILQNFQFCETQLVYEISEEIPSNLKLDFLMIVKESLANVMKHSNATEVLLELTEHPGFYRLRIKDNGNFEEDLSPLDFGMGLSSMAERIQKQKGRFTAERETDGYQIFVIVPKKVEENK